MHKVPGQLIRIGSRNRDREGIRNCDRKGVEIRIEKGVKTGKEVEIGKEVGIGKSWNRNRKETRDQDREGSRNREESKLGSERDSKSGQKWVKIRELKHTYINLVNVSLWLHDKCKILHRFQSYCFLAGNTLVPGFERTVPVSLVVILKLSNSKHLSICCTQGCSMQLLFIWSQEFHLL